MMNQGSVQKEREDRGDKSSEREEHVEEEAERWRAPLGKEEGLVMGLPGARYMSAALPPTYAYRLSRFAAKVGTKPAKYGITGRGGPKVLPYVSYPEWLEELVGRLLEMKLMQERPTQISVNHYVNQPEPYRLVPHIDGKKGQVVIVSLLSHCCLDFYKNSGQRDLSIPFTPSMILDEEDTREPIVSLLLEPASALVLTGESFHDFGHGILPRLTDEVSDKLGNYHLLTTVDKDVRTTTRGPRISLAIWSPS